MFLYCLCNLNKWIRKEKRKLEYVYTPSRTELNSISQDPKDLREADQEEAHLSHFSFKIAAYSSYWPSYCLSRSCITFSALERQALWPSPWPWDPAYWVWQWFQNNVFLLEHILTFLCARNKNSTFYKALRNVIVTISTPPLVIF